ncbi:MAG: 6-phosphogluconolactonase [Patescibacteria group bacterium]|nr:6-phosphogluconolactonase [Patescibacteria group bacterium]MDE1966768.1 6-phosphogluconolactonase [Patescibacteria group bacterium]
MRYISDRIIKELSAGKKVLWLVPGGSNIPLAVETMNYIKAAVGRDEMHRLTISLTDERYGRVGHVDSNWQQLLDAGFDPGGAASIPVLCGSAYEETISDWGSKIHRAFGGNDLIIGQFGIGSDGHIAGIHPHSVAVESKEFVCGYGTSRYSRITLTIKAILGIHAAYAFALDSAKKIVLETIRDKSLPIAEQPAQVLKKLPEAHLYGEGFVPIIETFGTGRPKGD